MSEIQIQIYLNSSACEGSFMQSPALLQVVSAALGYHCRRMAISLNQYLPAAEGPVGFPKLPICLKCGILC